MSAGDRHLARVEQLIDIGIALSAERDTNRLLEQILVGAKTITSADGGTLYLRENDTVRMEIIRTDSLNFAMGGTTGEPVPFPPISLFDGNGLPNDRMVVTSAVLHERTINIPDAYDAEGFDFSGTRAFDANTGYRSTSFLTVPMKNHEGEIIGVLQLLNAMDASGKVVPFDDTAQRLAEALASQAAIALTNKRLMDDLKALFESLIQLIADAIDEKSPYTGGHCRRVPIITMMLAEAVSRAGKGPLAEFALTDRDRYELEIASWLHDCGKIATPEYIVDKATKLETIHDRIHEVDTRIEVLKRDAEIAALQKKLALLEKGETPPDTIDEGLAAALARLDEEREFLRHANIGGEFMDEERKARVRTLAERSWHSPKGEAPLLDEDEVYNLCIPRGTLNDEERTVINNHISVTIKMLEALPLPKHLARVPEFAGGHHEKMDGTGYPRGLTREQMSVQARIMAIADIFEALTAKDRPYKKAKTLSESLRIMGFMVKDRHIDPDLFRIFIEEKVYLAYAREYLDPSQIDEVDPAALLPAS